jgi:hypothetical protein
MVDEALTPSSRQEIADVNALALGVLVESGILGTCNPWYPQLCGSLIAGALIKLGIQVSKETEAKGPWCPVNQLGMVTSSPGNRWIMATMYHGLSLSQVHWDLDASDSGKRGANQSRRNGIWSTGKQ